MSLFDQQRGVQWCLRLLLKPLDRWTSFDLWSDLENHSMVDLFWSQTFQVSKHLRGGLRCRTRRNCDDYLEGKFLGLFQMCLLQCLDRFDWKVHRRIEKPLEIKPKQVGSTNVRLCTRNGIVEMLRGESNLTGKVWKKLFSSLNLKPKKLWTCWDGKVALPLALNIRDRSRLLREEGKAFSSLMRS